MPFPDQSAGASLKLFLAGGGQANRARAFGPQPGGRRPRGGYERDCCLTVQGQGGEVGDRADMPSRF